MLAERIDEIHAKLMEEYRLKVQEISQKQKIAVQEELELENSTGRFPFFFKNT